MVISVQWGKILASTGKAFGISIIGYSLAAALYYGWLHAIAAYYGRNCQDWRGSDHPSRDWVLVSADFDGRDYGNPVP